MTRNSLLLFVGLCYILGTLTSCNTHSLDWALTGGFFEKEPPILVGITSLDPSTIKVIFNEPLDVESAELISNYQINPTLVLTDAELSTDQTTVLLTTETAQEPQTTYSLHVENIYDVFGNAIEQAEGEDFVGFGSLEDKQPPVPLYPTDGAAIYEQDVLLIWAAKQNAQSYDIDVALDEHFTQIVSTTTIDASSSSYTVSGLDPYQYWWRIRSDATEEDEYNIRSFQKMGDIIYVHCPASETTCTDADPSSNHVGNLTNPLHTISTALTNAKSYGMEKIYIAARGDGKAYEESINLISGVSIYGGYPGESLAGYSEASRDPNTYPTIITSSLSATLNAFGIQGDSNNQVIIDGVTIRGGDTGTETYAVKIGNCDENLVFQNTTIYSGEPDEIGYTIYLSDSGAVEFSTNTIIVQGSWERYGIYSMKSSPRIVQNTIEIPYDADEPGMGVGIYAEKGGMLTILNNSIEITSDSSQGISFMDGCTGIIQNNSISIADGSWDCTGLSIEAGNTLIDGNSLELGIAAGGSNRGMRLYAGDDVTVTNNTFQVGDSLGGETKGIFLQNAGTNVRIENNTITTGDPDDFSNSIGLELWSPFSSEVIISNNTITSGNVVDGATYGISGAANLSNNTITVGTSVDGNSYGIITFHPITCTNNTIQAGNITGTGTSYGIYHKNDEDNPSAFTGNSIQSGTTNAGDTYGFYSMIQDSSFGTGPYISAPVFENNIIQSGDSTDGSCYAIYNQASVVNGANTVHSNLELTNNIVISGDSTNAASYGIYNHAQMANINSPGECEAVLTLVNNTLCAGAGSPSTAFYNTYTKGTGTGTCTGSPVITYTIFFSKDSVNGQGFYESDNESSPTQFEDNLLFNCPDSWYYDADTGSAMSTLCLGDQIGIAGCGTILSTPITSGITTGSDTADVFATGFVQSDPLTWQIRGNGPADLDASGGWSTGDIGAQLDS